MRAVQVVLTTACNLRCAYCFQRAHPRRVVRWETVRAAVALLARSPLSEASLGFYGGEPLLEQRLLRRAVVHARRVLGHPSRRLRLQLTTNGTLLDSDLARFLAAHRVAVQLSFDGVPAAQQQRGAATFARLDALLLSLRREQPVFFDSLLSVTLTLTARNLPFLAESIDFLLDRRVAAIGISVRLTPDPEWSPAREPELDRELERVRRACLRVYARSGRVPVTLFRRGRLSRRGRAAEAPEACGAARGDALVVDADGSVTACTMFAAGYGALPATPLAARLAALHLGDVASPELPGRLAAHPSAARATGLFGGAATRSGRCRACACRSECLICPASVAHLPGDDPHGVAPLPCAFTRLVAKHRALFPPQPSLADVISGRASAVPSSRR